MPARDDQREENRKKWEAALLAEEKRRAESAIAVESIKKPVKEDDKPVKFSPAPAQVKSKGKDWAAVTDAAIKEGIEFDAKMGALVFASREDAVNFFKAQAKKGHAFFAREHVDGKASDFYVLACNKHLYTGSLSEIKKDLEAAIKKNPEDSKKLGEALEKITQTLKAQDSSADPAARMRGQLQDQRSNKEEKTPTNAPARR